MDERLQLPFVIRGAHCEKNKTVQLAVDLGLAWLAMVSINARCLEHCDCQHVFEADVWFCSIRLASQERMWFVWSR